MDRTSGFQLEAEGLIARLRGDMEQLIELIERPVPRTPRASESSGADLEAALFGDPGPGESPPAVG